MIGEVLGHYRIVERLGAGGMGEVYLAEDTELERRVALKILPSEMAADPERLERFRREAKAVAQLNHTNIVGIYTVEEAEGLRFFTMELVEGETLEELIPEGGMEPELLLDHAIPLARGLAAAHARGITHRDLKPSNVMVTEEGEVKILDFGLAKVEQSVAEETDLSRMATAAMSEAMTAEGVVLGTVPYMSPEQVEGKRLDPRSDVFSLGILLYEMATGKRPFWGESSARLMSSILRDDPPPPTEVRSELPDALGRIIGHCLEKDPGNRYPSATEVLAALERSRAAPGGASRAERSLGTATRRRWAWSLVTLAALVAIVALAVLLGRQAAGPESVAPEISSLAVLPLENLSGDPAQEYFADGMTELLITDLSKIGSLKVISRTSVMRFKDSAIPLREIAETLDVDAVVEGSVLRAGDEVRITAQLIDARADEHLWAESYQHRVENVLSLQSDVARAIAREIRVVLTPEERARLQAGRSVDPEALDAYLQGRDLWQRWGPYIEQSIPHFLRAIEIDPDYALAHAGLADAYLVLAHFARPAEEAMPLAKQSALRALELDPELAEAHTSLADTVFHYDWDWERAEREFERAVELNPGYATAHWWYSGLLAALGRHEEAIREIEQARALEPLNYMIQAFGVRVLAWAGRGEQALQLAAALRERFPEASPEAYAMALAINDRPLPGEILSALERQAETVTLPHPKAVLAVTLAGSGEGRIARQLLEELQSVYRTTYVSPYMIAQSYSLLGESDRALGWLEEAFDRRAAELIWIDVEPAFEPLRGAERFEMIVSSMDFPDRGSSS